MGLTSASQPPPQSTNSPALDSTWRDGLLRSPGIIGPKKQSEETPPFTRKDLSWGMIHGCMKMKLFAAIIMYMCKELLHPDPLPSMEP